MLIGSVTIWLPLMSKRSRLRSSPISIGSNLPISTKRTPLDVIVVEIELLQMAKLLDLRRESRYPGQERTEFTHTDCPNSAAHEAHEGNRCHREWNATSGS